MLTCGLGGTAQGKSQSHGFDSSSVLKLSAAPWPFCLVLSQSVHVLLHCCALYNFLDFHQENQENDYFALNVSTSDFHCFGVLGVRPAVTASQDSASSAGLLHEQ